MLQDWDLPDFSVLDKSRRSEIVKFFTDTTTWKIMYSTYPEFHKKNCELIRMYVTDAMQDTPEQTVEIAGGIAETLKKRRRNLHETYAADFLKTAIEVDNSDVFEEFFRYNKALLAVEGVLHCSVANGVLLFSARKCLESAGRAFAYAPGQIRESPYILGGFLILLRHMA
jgi:hypothetical protein